MLKINNVYKAYKTNQVLKGITTEVNKGEIKGLIGVNGAGKSTLIELVCGVKSIDSGEILLDGIDVKDQSRRNEIKYIIGYMPQSFTLFNDLTVRENMGYLSAVYGLDENMAVDRVLNLCNLTSMADRLAQNLSGGYRQLLSLAGAIIHSPKLLILDEPTSAMDPLFRKSFWKIVKSCRDEGCTVLVITHYMEELFECDSFACISSGKIAFDGETSRFKHLGELNIEKILEMYTKD